MAAGSLRPPSSCLRTSGFGQAALKVDRPLWVGTSRTTPVCVLEMLVTAVNGGSCIVEGTVWSVLPFAIPCQCVFIGRCKPGNACQARTIAELGESEIARLASALASAARRARRSACAGESGISLRILGAEVGKVAGGMWPAAHAFVSGWSMVIRARCCSCRAWRDAIHQDGEILARRGRGEVVSAPLEAGRRQYWPFL